MSAAKAADSTESTETPPQKPGEGPDKGTATLRIVGEEAGVRRPLLPFVALVLLAAAVMAWGLVSWHRAATDPVTATAEARDAVLIAATNDVATLNSLDSAHVDEGLARWRAVSTGKLHDQLAQVDASQTKLLQQQNTSTKGHVVGAAVFSLDTSARTATVLASVEVTVADASKPGAKPTVKRNRFKADLVQVHGRWLVQNLEQVAVAL